MNEPTAATITARERRLVTTFVELADTLTEDYDIVEVLQTLAERVVELGLATETGLLLADEVGELQLVAASQERSHLLELFQLQSREGPCLDCFRTGDPVEIYDLADVEERWPRFGPRALSVGFRSIHAVPLRLRRRVLGAMNLFRTEPSNAQDEQDQVVTQALADSATIALLQQRSLSEAQQAAEQLQQALHSRVAIEQAKGVLAAQAETTPDEAFARLRRFARANNRKLTDVAGAVVRRELVASDLTDPA